MLLLALGQKKMFQNVLPAVLHGFIYVAFIITQVEMLEIFADGVSGQMAFQASTGYSSTLWVVASKAFTILLSVLLRY